MLTKADFLCGTLIAPQKIKFSKTSLMSNLEELLHLQGDYSTFTTQAAEQTKDPEFIGLAEEVAQNIADELVQSVLRIKEHVVPVLNQIVRNVVDGFSSGRILEKTISGLNTNFGCLDNPFFDSDLFPTGRKSTVLSYERLQLRGEFPDGMIDDVELTEELISQFVVKHPVITRLFNNPDEDYREAIRFIHSREWWSRHFGENNGEYCQFNKVEYFDLNAIFRVYVVLSRIRASESLLLPVKGVSLERYKTLINDLWEGMNVYLPMLKIMCDHYRKEGLVIRQKSKFELYEGTFDGIKMKVLHGDCDILYSRKYATHIDDNGSSLAEVAYNYILHIIESGGRPNVSALAFVGMNEGTFGEHVPLEALLRSNMAACREKASDLINLNARVLITKKLAEMGIENPDLKPLDHFYIEGGSINGLNIESLDIHSSIMSSGIGGVLLGLMGYRNAEKLLSFVRHEMESEHGKTKAMARAYAAFAVWYLTRHNEALVG